MTKQKQISQKQITVLYSASDGWKTRRSFKTLTAARKFARKWVGAHPEIGSTYAISGDGVGKVTVDGASLADLFPAPESSRSDDDNYDDGAPDPDAAYERFLETRYQGLDEAEAIAFGRWEELA